MNEDNDTYFTKRIIVLGVVLAVGIIGQGVENAILVDRFTDMLSSYGF